MKLEKLVNNLGFWMMAVEPTSKINYLCWRSPPVECHLWKSKTNKPYFSILRG
ncbi:MAG: hypothetical protein V7K98_21980 [Nostoc sp.]|uniref:hypothetical protein n=1 Tax=Nostoc sp. TaxID=1180 RepID=UPI002FF7D414